MVPWVGLEPTTLAGRDFESRAYTSSATMAMSTPAGRSTNSATPAYYVFY